jgi:RecB family exonuclease/DnaJ-domain-containing protein 1
LGEPHPLIALPAGAALLPLSLPNLPVMEWHGFWQAVLNDVPHLPPHLSGKGADISAAHVAVCAEVCQRLLDEGSYFGRVRHSPRFHRQLVARWVEWGQNGLTPQRLEQAAQAVMQPRWSAMAGIDSPPLQAEWQRKAGELCQLWRAWAEQLPRRQLSNPCEWGWELAAYLEESRLAEPKRLLLWGFRELKEAEIALLRALERAGYEVNLALPYDPNQPDRFAPTRALLEQLEADERVELAGRVDGSAGVALTVLSAADSLREAEVAARQLLGAIQAGVPPEQMVVLIRQPSAAAERLAIVFERYGIPFHLEASLPLSRAPIVRMVLRGLSLLLGSGDGRDWLEWLQQVPHGLAQGDLYRLVRVGRPTRPADEWFEAAQRTLGSEPAFATLFEQLNTLRQRVRSPSPNLQELIALLMGWLIAPSDGTLHSANERAALERFQQLVQAYAPLLQPMPLAGAIAYLGRLCDAESYTHAWGRAGVRVLPLEMAGLVHAPIVVAMELVEGVLPRRHPDDPFLRESERRALRAYFEHLQATEPSASPVRLILPSERQRMEPMLFYEVLTAATQQLYLSYPRTMENGETLPSSYLTQLTPAADASEASTEGSGHCEWRIYRLEELVPPESERLHPYDRLLAHAVEHSGDGCECVVHRESLGDDFRLTLPRTRQQLVDVDRVFSVSELETLHRCPFQHLFRHRLRVRVPRRGLQLTQIGSVLHAALRHAYHHHRQVSPDSPEWAQTLLRSLEQVLKDTPLDLAHWQLQVLHAYATRLLQLFAQREARYRQQFQLEPRHFEWAFGASPSHDLGDETDGALLGGAHDPASLPSAFRIQLGNGQSMRVCGVVDRIDLSPDGKLAMVTDYKLTRSPQQGDIVSGTAFQPLLYTLVVQAHHRVNSVVIAFDELSHGRRVRYVPYEEGLIRRFRAGDWEGTPTEVMRAIPHRRLAQAIDQLRTELRHLLQLLQGAHILPLPGDHCRRCAFGDLCRKAQR